MPQVTREATELAQHEAHGANRNATAAHTEYVVTPATANDISAIAALRVLGFRNYQLCMWMPSQRQRRIRKEERVLLLVAASGKLLHCGIVRDNGGKNVYFVWPRCV